MNGGSIWLTDRYRDIFHFNSNKLKHRFGVKSFERGQRYMQELIS